MNRTRILPLLAMLALLAPRTSAQDEAEAEEKTNREVVVAVRAVLGARHAEEEEKLKAELFARDDLDWASFGKGLEEGPYYQKPLVTAYGERHGRRDFDLVFSGEDGTPRSFSMWVPKAYDAEKPVPLLLYLHHSPQDPHINNGRERAGVAVLKFKEMAEEHGIFFVAPYTSKGAEWWTEQGRKLVQWTLREVRRRYKVDDDRVGLMGALGGADAVWYLGQEMPGTWSVLMPMTGDPYEITAIVRPLFLGTLDRMDVLMGVPGVTKSTIGQKDQNRFLADLKPMFAQGMRITTTVWPHAQGDYRYLEDVTGQIASFVLSRKRKAYADEVDVETEEGHPLRSLWLRNDGYLAEGSTAPADRNFKSTLLKWDAPEYQKPEPKLGVSIHEHPGWSIGVTVTGTPGAAKNSLIYPRDVLLEVDGEPIRKAADIKAAIQDKDWNTEVEVLLAREVKESDLPRHEWTEKRYALYRARIEELRAAGEPVPDNLWAEITVPGGPAEDEPAEEIEDEEIIIGGAGDEPAGGKKPRGKIEAEETEIRLIERWVTLQRPAGTFVRADFGAGVDPGFDQAGVKIGYVFPNSLADRSGLKEGDIVVQVGDTEVKSVHDVEDYFRTAGKDGGPFRFEKEEAGDNFVDFTMRRQNPNGTFTEARQVTVRWEPVRSSRVDAKWNKKENTLEVLAHHASGFTLFFHDELIEPGKEFHLFINGVPYQDLVEPASAPEYPDPGPDADPVVADELYRMRRERAKVEGWKPDFAFALEHYLDHRDRRQVYGAEMTIDLTGMTAGFEKAKERRKGRRGELGERVAKAYEARKTQ